MSKLNTEHFYKGITDSGKKRNHNEDYFVVDENLGLSIVCDGMGGHAAGEVASQLTTQVIHAHVKENENLLVQYEQKPSQQLRSEIKKMINDGVQKACRTVWQKAQVENDKTGMGTTVVMMLICGNSGFVAHVGDSRVYLYREGKCRQLTEDHTLVNEYIRQGLIEKDKAFNHPQANIIMRSVGVQEVVQVDVVHMELMSDDRFILCTDGLGDYLKNDNLVSFFEKKRFENLSQDLVGFANESGGKDNITVVTIEYRKLDLAAGARSKIVSKKIDTLQKIPLFKDFTYQELNKLLEIIEVRTYQEGQTIIVENEKGNEMFVTLRGLAQVTLQGVEINKIGPSAYFGEMVLIDDAPRMATVRAMQKCKFLVFKKEGLFKLLDKEPTMASKVYWGFLLTLNNRLRDKEYELLPFKKAS